MVAYMKAKEKAGYKRNVENFMDDLKRIRLACLVKKKSRKVKYQLETIPKELVRTTKILGITDDTVRIPLNVGVYTR